MSFLLLASTVALLLAGASDSFRTADAFSAREPAAPVAADSVVIQKSTRHLTLYLHGQPVRTYVVALGKNPVGDKERAGDDRTPEGLFRIEGRNSSSQYHLALRISYPDSAHRARAAALGVSPGGDIMIHGLPNGMGEVGSAHREFDWTNGCIAVTDSEIEQIWRALPDGAPIQIKP